MRKPSRLLLDILGGLFVLGLALSVLSAWRSHDGWRLGLNLGTEPIGAS